MNDELKETRKEQSWPISKCYPRTHLYGLSKMTEILTVWLACRPRFRFGPSWIRNRKIHESTGTFGINFNIQELCILAIQSTFMFLMALRINNVVFPGGITAPPCSWLQIRGPGPPGSGSLESETVKCGHVPPWLGPKNDCAGKDQQQL
jgi:hypothetical protein